ncbi:MAG: FMN-binding glutamate synthase family protein [Gammaproteobacteria bacterium]|nr:FMN-binding glutamate synthase family protein [Gammaproteobacteria bacterium]
MRIIFVVGSILSLLVIFIISWFEPEIGWFLLLIVPLIAVGLYDMFQTKHSLRRNFPLIGRGRWFMEFVRPFVRQYFIESDIDGAPVNRMFRSIIYQRAKCSLDTNPYGTKVDTYRQGYEWFAHSLVALQLKDEMFDPRVLIGGTACKKPYSASVLNISAMSFGALSSNAIRALNKGAKIGGFAHNTGEGSVSPFHLENNGDLIWQIGTGYFGCRTEMGLFCKQAYEETVAHESIKMVEIKLSQGAKPGHGGILPAAKNSPTIAKIRGVKPYTIVDSPPAHTAFSTPIEMMGFIQTLRDLSGGKPIGIKLCVGRPSEFIALCKAMIKTGIRPDFITVDGAEGGTGAAPLEFSNSVGMPLRDGLRLVCDVLTGFDLKKDIKVIAVGKVFSGFHIARLLGIGADLCYSARGMMMALGCVQSLICNTNECPTGVATQKENLIKGLVVADKSQRVANFHLETVKAFMQIIAAAGLVETTQVNRGHIFRRVDQTCIKRYDELYPNLTPGCLLRGLYPEYLARDIKEASAESFLPAYYSGSNNKGLTDTQKQ